MLNQFSRTELLIGKEGIEKLKDAKVAVFGIGGVGSFVVEGLARAGIGNFILIDDDKICLTNLNRQIIATRKTIGKYKVEVAKERILCLVLVSLGHILFLNILLMNLISCTFSFC